MNFGEQLLGLFAQYGVPLLCGVTLLACAGLPLPVSLLLVAAGSFADHGEMNGPAVLIGATIAAILGDQLGFSIGRWGGRRWAQRLSRRVGGERRLAQAESRFRRWGGASIFLTRWLFTALGPLVNLVSGFAGYSWPRFLVWDVLGEALWVSLYVMLGETFGHQVQTLSGLLGNTAWAIFALCLAIYIAWRLIAIIRARRGSRSGTLLVH